MVPAENGVNKDKIQQELYTVRSSTGMGLMDHIPINISTIERELIMDHNDHEERFLDFLKDHPSNSNLPHNAAPENESSSPSDPAPNPASRHVSFVRKIKWASLMRYSKKWIKHPANLAVFIWSQFVVAGILMYVLVATGILNGLIPGSGRRKDWTEAINQILNALFMIMCLYQHPYLFHHLVLLCRWNPSDRVRMRKSHCKDGGVRPHERAHMMFVVLLLHATCISQYVTCALYWAYDRHTRPDWAVNLCLVIGIATPIIAGVHAVRSPMGKRYENVPEIDQESQQSIVTEARPGAVSDPEWIGGVFDCCDDPTVASCSLFCTFCVFGWNMERLGFGNMYVHISVFVLLCTAPFLIFGAAAISIHDDDDSIAYIVAITGAVLCVFGLLYGGFWRTEMRKKFKLPANPFCCGYAMLTDYMQWLFCWSCSLAQEVRTANFYDIDGNNFHSKTSDESGNLVLLPLRREGESGPLNGHGFDSSIRSYSSPPQFRSINPPSSTEVVSGFSPADFSRSLVRSSTDSKFHGMTPPLPPLIQLEEK